MTRYSLLLLALAACDGNTGTLSVALVTAPGSTVLEPVVRARLIVSDPYTVVEVARGEPLSVEVDADGQGAELRFEGLDASGARVAVGRTPLVPIAAVDADVRIYVAAPMSIAAAPVTLDPPRAELGAGPLPYGVLLAGGVDAAGAPLDQLTIYNAYVHTLQDGARLPAPRRELSVGIGRTGFAYLYGGRGGDGEPTGTLWRFDTNAAPNGRYVEGAPARQRAGAAIVPLRQERFLITGRPAMLLDGLRLSVDDVTEPPRLGGTATAVTSPNTVLDYAVFVGEDNGDAGVVYFNGAALFSLEAPTDALRSGHSAAAVGDAVVVVGGGSATQLTRSGLRVIPAADPDDARVELIPDAIDLPRRHAAVAASGGLLLIAGGTDPTGAVVGDVEVRDATTLAPVARLSLAVPRTGAVAHPLGNGQILIAGGRGADGAPVSALELFTPDLPAP